MMTRTAFSTYIMPTIEKHMHRLRATDVESIKRRRGSCHAFVMLVCLTVLLGVIYFSQEPYRYTVSSVGFKKNLHISQLQEDDLELSEVWEWFDDLLDELGGESSRSVKLNCAYDHQNSQPVLIDGVQYYLVDPAPDDAACHKLGYIDGADDKVHLAGVHQVLSFGAFSTRARKEAPRKGSVIPEQQTSTTVAESHVSSLNALQDERVVRLCHLDGADSYEGSYCISEDEVSSFAGSTFNWKGAEFTLAGITYRAFETGSNSTLFLDEVHNYTTIFPCFELTAAPSVVSGLHSFSGSVEELAGNLSCSLAWITSGRSVRDNCLTALGDQATPVQAYVAGIYHMDTVPELYELEYGCSTLLSWPEDDMNNVFLEQSRSLTTFLSSDQAYGSFFPTSSLKNWVEDSAHFSTQFQMSNALDLETRNFFVYLITRNLNEDGLFYARIRITFTFAVEGTATVALDTTFSPMIDFSYGTSGHSWIFQDVLIWESVLLLFFAFFAIREFLQLVQYIRKKHNLISVQPAVECSNSSSEIAHDDTVPPASPILQIESDKNLDHDEDTSGGHHLEQSEGTDMIKPDDYRSVSRSSFIHNFDLNNNGKGDLKELEQLAADAVPDSSVFGNVLDWITVGIISSLLGLRFDYISTTRRLHELILDLSEQHNYSDRMALIVSSFDSISSLLATQRLLLMLVMFVGMTQFFRYLSFDSRLGIVAETVLHSIEDLLPVLFIFVFVLMGFSVLGASIFGQDVESWSTVGSSMLNLMIFIVGEYGTYFEIYEKQPAITAIFFWSYMVVAYFIIFNMILAIIFNVYNKKTEALLEESPADPLLGDENSSVESRKER